MNFSLILLTFLQMYFIKSIVATWKIICQVAVSQQEVATFTVVASMVMNFIFKNIAIDSILFLLLFILISIDTIVGGLLAKERKNYDWKVLKTKTLLKLQGYIFFIMGLFFVTLMLFLFGHWKGEPIVSEYILNIPLMTTFLFFGAIEFISIKNNVTLWTGIRTPISVVGKFEKFVENGDPTELNSKP